MAEPVGSPWPSHQAQTLFFIEGFMLQVGQFLGSRGDFLPEALCTQLAGLHDSVRFDPPLPFFVSSAAGRSGIESAASTHILCFIPIIDPYPVGWLGRSSLCCRGLETLTDLHCRSHACSIRSANGLQSRKVGMARLANRPCTGQLLY